MFFEQIKHIVNRELGMVDVTDLGFLAPGVWGIQIIVGEKANQAYSPLYNPNVDVLDRTKLPKMVPDVRILKLNGMEDERAVMIKLKPIKDTMSDYRKMPTFKEGMSGINSDPMRNYMTPEEQGVNTAINSNRPQDEADFQAEIAKQNEIAAGIPEPTKESGFMEEIMGALSDIGNKIGSIEQRVNNIEQSKGAEKKIHWKTLRKQNKEANL